LGESVATCVLAAVVFRLQSVNGLGAALIRADGSAGRRWGELLVMGGQTKIKGSSLGLPRLTR